MGALILTVCLSVGLCGSYSAYVAFTQLYFSQSGVRFNMTLLENRRKSIVLEFR